MAEWATFPLTAPSLQVTRYEGLQVKQSFVNVPILNHLDLHRLVTIAGKKAISPRNVQIPKRISWSSTLPCNVLRDRSPCYEAICLRLCVRGVLVSQRATIFAAFCRKSFRSAKCRGFWWGYWRLMSKIFVPETCCSRNPHLFSFCLAITKLRQRSHPTHKIADCRLFADEQMDQT